MYRNFRSQNFFCYMDTFIAIIMYCQRLVNNIVYIKKFFRGTYLQRISVFMQNFKFGGVTVLAVQLFNKIKRKKKKKTKNMKKHVSLFSQMLCRNIFIFVEFIPFCMFLTLMSQEMEITLN